jgi:SAM-dependent methyltransferase
MESKEIYLFSRIEKEHFFYRARRDIVKVWLSRLFPNPGLKPLVVDAGAGTGIFVKEIQGTCEAVGSDIFFEPGVSLAGTDLVRADAARLPFSGNTADASVALDLLEHLDNDAAGMKELERITKPGGYVFINVPAFQLLWSDWDQAVGHKRRYKKQMLKALAEQAGLEIIFLSYVNSLPFFPILLYRWLRSTFGFGKNQRLEDKLPPALVNRFFLWAFVEQGIRGWIKLPFGVSLFCVLRKKSGNKQGEFSSKYMK